MPFPAAYAESPKGVTIPIYRKYAQRAPPRKRSEGDAILKAGLPAAGTPQTGDSFRGNARKPLPHGRHAGTLLTGSGRSRYKTERPPQGKTCGSPCPAVVALPPVTAPCPAFPKQNPRRRHSANGKGIPFRPPPCPAAQGPKPFRNGPRIFRAGRRRKTGRKAPRFAKRPAAEKKSTHGKTLVRLERASSFEMAALPGTAAGCPCLHHENPGNRAQDAAQESVKLKRLAIPRHQPERRTAVSLPHAAFLQSPHAHGNVAAPKPPETQSKIGWASR